MGAQALQEESTVTTTSEPKQATKGPVAQLQDRCADLKARVLKDKSVSYSQFAEGLDILSEVMAALQSTNIDKFLTGEISFGQSGEPNVADNRTVDEKLRDAAEHIKNGNGNHDGGTGKQVAASTEDEPKGGVTNTTGQTSGDASNQ